MAAGISVFAGRELLGSALIAHAALHKLTNEALPERRTRSSLTSELCNFQWIVDPNEW
jgi:hypothetical protein